MYYTVQYFINTKVKPQLCGFKVYICNLVQTSAHKDLNNKNLKFSWDRRVMIYIENSRGTMKVV